MNNTDAAYIAGLFDGEGWISIRCIRANPNERQLNRRFNVAMGLANTNLEVVVFVRSIFGGAIDRKTKRTAHHQDCWEWRLREGEIIPFCNAVLPYLRIQKAARTHCARVSDTVHVRSPIE